MTHRTLDEYLKQATTHATTKYQTTRPKYRIVGFYKETEFRETPIGKIPKQWKIVTLERIAEIVNGYTFPLELQGKKAGKYPFIKVGDMNNSYKYLTRAENYVDDDDLRKLRARVFPKGTIIFPKIGMAMKLNKFRILGCDALFDNNVAGLIPKNVNNEFLYYYFSGKVNLISLAGATTVPSITKTRLRKLLIPLPPLEEQWGIAEVLSTLDKAIEETERLIERLERLKCGLMQELLTKGIGHREYKQTPIGKIPKEWQLVPLSKIAKIIMGQSPPSSTYNEEGVGLPFLQGKAEFGRIYPTPKMYTSKPVKIAEKGDLLISVRAPVGDVNIAPYRLCIGRGLAAIRFTNNVANTLFYFYYFNFIKPRLEAMGKGSTFKAITKKDLESLLVPRPPLEEQKIIADTLYSIDKWIEVEEKRRKKLERLKRGLMELLLTGRVRVRVEKVGKAEDSPGSGGVVGR